MIKRFLINNFFLSVTNVNRLNPFEGCEMVTSLMFILIKEVIYIIRYMQILDIDIFSFLINNFFGKLLMLTNANIFI